MKIGIPRIPRYLLFVVIVILFIPIIIYIEVSRELNWRLYWLKWKLGKR